MLLVVCLLFVCLFVVSSSLSVVGSSVVVRCPLSEFVGRCLLVDVCCLLFVVYCLFVIRCSLCVVRCLLFFVVCFVFAFCWCLLFVGCRVFFVK